MASSKVAFVVVGLACVVAAGTGGYLAQRQSAPEAATVATAAPAATMAAAAAPAVAPEPAREPEAIVARPAKAVKLPKTVVAAKPERAQAPSARVSLPTPPPQSPAPEPVAPPVRTETVERVPLEAPAPPPPPQRTFDELVVSTDSVIGLQSDSTVTSERARVEDRVEARVTRDVKVADRVAIPAGSRAIGYVTAVERGGKFKEQAKLAIRFQTIVLADGTRLPISTAAVEREGDGKGGSSAAKMGGAAVAGTILGAILGGGKGAAIGGAAGAGAGAAAVQAGDRSVATLRAGEPITIRLLSPVTVTSENK